MSLNIYICDDAELVSVALKKLIEEAAVEMGMEVSVHTAMSGEELLPYAEAIDALMLDIDMPEMDGLETGRIIKKRNPECIIIMATGHPEMVRESIHMGVSDFITKPFKKEDVRISLEIIKNKTSGLKEIQVYNKRNKYILKENEIDRIEAYNGYVYIYSKEKRFRKEVSLKKILEELDERIFFQTDRKTIVNLASIESAEKERIFINGEEIKVARDRRKSFEKAYMEYDLYYRRIFGKAL